LTEIDDVVLLSNLRVLNFAFNDVTEFPKGTRTATYFCVASVVHFVGFSHLSLLRDLDAGANVISSLNNLQPFNSLIGLQTLDLSSNEVCLVMTIARAGLRSHFCS
jgi:Leucine-rich repeat (LRR) protein